MENPRIAFFGTPALCTLYLDALAAAGMSPGLIVTNPDRKVGRGNKRRLISPEPKSWADTHDVACLQPEKINEDFLVELRREPWDIFIVVAYGKILPQELLDIPTHGSLNVHYSLLPRWRGASPTEAAILAGDSETGVCIQQMVYELDAGPIVAQRTLTILPETSTIPLRHELSLVGSQLLTEILPDYLAGGITPTEQDRNAATHCRKIKKEHGEITLGDDPLELWRKYRAYHPWPGLYFWDENGKRIKISQASWQDGEFIIEKVIPEGKGEVDYRGE